jgi:hypothetical protein
MKLLLSLFFASALFTAQAQDTPVEYTSYGDAITVNGALSVDEFSKATASSDSLTAKLKAEILGSCSKKGCWMTVKMSDGASMMVRFRDYAFFVPKEGLEGKEVVMQGRAKKEVTSVAMLRHYAEDAGKSKEEIAAITEPETSWQFEADGVLIRK